MTKRKLLTPKEMVEIYGFNEATLRTWRGQRKGPSYVKIGRKVMYREQDVDRWVRLNWHPTIDQQSLPVER